MKKLVAFAMQVSPLRVCVVLMTLLLTSCAGTKHRNADYGGQTRTQCGNSSSVIPSWEPVRKANTRPYTVLGKSYRPHKNRRHYKKRGLASWYGKKFHGKKTATGETYNMYAMTAAHKTLALPNYVCVHNPRNGRSVIVRVNDRGPFYAKRIIDLSYAAARKLGLSKRGVGEVIVESLLPGGGSYAEVKPPKAPQAAPAAILQSMPVVAGPVLEPHDMSPGAYLQVGAFKEPNYAHVLRTRIPIEISWLDKPTQVVRTLVNDELFYRVNVGPYSSRAAAENDMQRIIEQTGQEPWVVNWPDG